MKRLGSSPSGDLPGRPEASTVPRGPDLGFVRAWFARHWLPVWFLALTGARIVQIAASGRLDVFFDGRLYLAATRHWLAGGNPWEIAINGIYFAAPPPTLAPLAPIAALPGDVALVVLVGLVGAAAVATILLLRLPWWWLAFPPLFECVLTANVHAIVLPLLLVGAGWAAVVLKVYAAVPLLILGRWRELLAAAAVMLATVPFLPWAQFVGGWETISAHLAEQSRYGPDGLAWLIALPLGIGALALVGRERAAWMAVPALWPSSQFYYTTFAMATRDKLLAAIVASPLPASGLVALLVAGAVAVRARRNGGRVA